MKRTLATLALSLAAVLPAVAQQPAPGAAAAPPRAEVLVVGVFHMANPGHDIFNMAADDVLAPKRQAEIAQVVALLREFRPTKVAVERDSWDSRIAKDYADYLAGKHELTRNEIEQLGFRLARELGHERVYPVDADGEFPYQRLVNHAKATGRSKELEAVMAGFGDMVTEQGEYLASHTILETLLTVNSDARVARDFGLYHRMARFSEPGDWAGPDLVSDWFRRNMRIHGNVVRLADSPGERIVVIYGSGHLAWLQRSFAGDPDLRLRKLAEFVR